LVTVLIAILVPSNSLSVMATAFTGSRTLITVASLAGAILLMIWFGRRK
jgi:hypothetical protein